LKLKVKSTLKNSILLLEWKNGKQVNKKYSLVVVVLILIVEDLWLKKKMGKRINQNPNRWIN